MGWEKGVWASESLLAGSRNGSLREQGGREMKEREMRVGARSERLRPVVREAQRLRQAGSCEQAEKQSQVGRAEDASLKPQRARSKF